MPIGIRGSAKSTDLILGPHTLYLIFLLVFQRSNEVDALLNGPHWGDFVVDFHRPMRPSLIGVLSCLIVNGTIEKFALRLVYLLVAATMEHDEIAVPAIGHLEVLLG